VEDMTLSADYRALLADYTALLAADIDSFGWKYDFFAARTLEGSDVKADAFTMTSLIFEFSIIIRVAILMLFRCGARFVETKAFFGKVSCETHM